MSIQWPSFTGTATQVGVSPSGKVAVYYDASLGAQALQNAKDLMANADTIVEKNDAMFGTTGGPTNVIVFALGGATDGTGGADHMGCDYQTGENIECCAAYGQSNRVEALYEAELSECSMNNNLCGESTGEALSRWCSMWTSNNALSDFASAPTWVQSGYSDWVSKTEDTDQDYDSIGCGMAFLSWLQSLGYSINKIAPTMVALGNAGTLAQLYSSLSGDTTANALTKFMAAVKAISVTTDDPFNALTGAGSGGTGSGGSGGTGGGGSPVPANVEAAVLKAVDALFAANEAHANRSTAAFERIINNAVDKTIKAAFASTGTSPSISIPWGAILSTVIGVLKGAGISGVQLWALIPVIIADILAGKTAAQIAADILSSLGIPTGGTLAMAMCPIKHHSFV